MESQTRDVSAVSLTAEAIVMKPDLKFVRFSGIAPAEVAHHMSNPWTAVHVPLLTSAWDQAQAVNFIAMEDACWARDWLGHSAFLADGR